MFLTYMVFRKKWYIIYGLEKRARFFVFAKDSTEHQAQVHMTGRAAGEAKTADGGEGKGKCKAANCHLLHPQSQLNSSTFK